MTVRLRDVTRASMVLVALAMPQRTMGQQAFEVSEISCAQSFGGTVQRGLPRECREPRPPPEPPAHQNGSASSSLSKPSESSGNGGPSSTGDLAPPPSLRSIFQAFTSVYQRPLYSLL
jgi:hypothetical protein